MAVMSGAEFWALRATHGLPLDLIVDELSAAGIYPAWDQVLEAAKEDGANLRKLVVTLTELYAGKLGGEHIRIGLKHLLDRCG